MPGYCVIPSCKNRGGFSFPKDEAVRAKWVAAIKRRNWTPSPYSIVCHTHFVETDFHFYEGNVTLDGVPRRYQTLKKGVVPSIFPWSKPKSEAAILRDRRQSRRDAEDADRQMKRRQELREAGITPSSPLWKPGLLGAIKFKTMPREIKTPARYATEDAPSTSKPKRGRPPSSASKVKATPSSSRPSAKKVIDSIIIGDDDSDVEILDTPPSRKRKSADDNDPDWGSGRKVSRSKRGSQDRRTRESTRTAATPPSPGVAAVAKQVAAAAKQVAAPKSKQNTSVKQTPSPKVSALPKASPKITVKTSMAQNRPKTVITKLSHWETPAVNAIDLCMECKEEPLSPAQMKAMANEKAQYDKSQNLVKAAREGRLVFLPGGETKILDKPFSMVYTPQTPPAPVIPPPVPSPAPVPVSMMPKSLLIPGPMGRSNSPDLMIVAETPPRLTAQVMQLTPNINTVSKPATATTHTAPNAIKLVHGTCGLGIRLPPGWEPLPTAPAPVAKTPTPPKASTPKLLQVTPKAMTTARAKAQSEALAFLRQQMQQEAQAKAESETQKKKAKKIAQLEGDESGNWVPLDEYYYGKMEGNPTYSELKGEHRFKCWYCNKMLYNNVAAMMHIQGHIDSERQVNLDLSDLTQCKHCYKQFDTPFEMQTHIEKVHMNNTNVLLCRICEKDHDSRQGLTDHMRRCHNACEMPYICQLCKFRSSMYSDVVDHFKKKHNSSESMLCLYCLRVFHIRFVSQGWGQTSVYYNHLMKHQVKNSCKKCALCKLIFLNPADLKAHRKADHEANQKGVIGMNAKYTTPDQVMIKVTEKGPNMKAGGGVKSLNVPAVKKIMEHRLSFPSEVYKVKCIECKMLMGIPDHYKKFIQCSMCRFATSCSFAYSNHMMGFHSGQLTAAASHTPNEEKLENQLYCSCGFTSSYGNKLANHLVACSKSSCYKDPPPPSAGDEFGQELQDPRKKPDASLLDILGLVKKDSLPTSSGKSIRHESPPPEPVDMPDVEMSDRPARRPSLLKDSMKKSFKTILKDEKDLEPPQEIRRIDDKSSTENRRDSSAEAKMEDGSETKTKGEEDSKTEKDDSKKEETDAGNQKKEGDAELAKEGEESKEDTKEDSKEGKEEINNEKKEADFDSKQDVKENAEVGKKDADIEIKEDDDDKSSILNAEGKVEGTKEDEQKKEIREIKDNEAEVKTEEKKDTMDVEDKKTEEEMEEDNGNEVAKDDTEESVRVPDVEKNLEDSKMKQTESDKSVDMYKETRENNDENVEKKGEEMVEESSGFASGSVSGKKTLGLGLDYGSGSENEDEEEKVNEGGEEKSEDIPEKTPAATEERSDLAVSSKEMTTTVDEKAEDDKEEDDVEEKRESVGGLVDYNDEEEKEEDSNKGNEGENNLAEKAEEFQSGIDNDDTSGQSAVAGMETQDNEEVEDKSTVDKKNDDEEEDIGDMDKEEKMTGLEEENIDDEELRYDTPVQDEVNDIKNIDENKEEERMDISEEKEDLSQSSSSSQKQQELKPDRQEGESLHKSTENTEESSESASTEALFSEPVAPRYDKPASRVLGKSVGDVWEGSSNARDWRESFSSQRTTTTSDLTTGPTVHDMLTAALPADDNNTTSSGEDNLMTAPPADVRLTEAGEKSSPSISQGSDGFSDLKTKEDQTQSSLNLISGYDNDDEAVDDGKGTEESPSDAKTSEMEQVKTQQSETGKNTAGAASVPFANDSREGADDRDVMSSESGDRQREPSVSSSSQSQDRDRGQSNTRDRSRSRSRDRQRDRRSRSRDRDRDRDRHRDRDRDRDRHRERRSRSRDRDRDRHRDRDRDRYYDRDRDRDRHRDRSRDRDRYRERDRSRERDRDRDRERDRDRDYRRYRDDRRYR